MPPKNLILSYITMAGACFPPCIPVIFPHLALQEWQELSAFLQVYHINSQLLEELFAAMTGVCKITNLSQHGICLEIFKKRQEKNKFSLDELQKCLDEFRLVFLSIKEHRSTHIASSPHA